MAEWQAGGGTLSLGIIGTVLGGLAVAGNGLLGGVMNGTTYEKSYATMHDIEDAKMIAEKDSEIAQLKAQQIVDAKIVDTYKELSSRINTLEKEQEGKWGSQAVINSTLNSSVNVLNSQVSDVANTLNNLTKVVIPSTNVCQTNSCNCNM